MSKAGENILGRGGRKTMDVAESRSSDEVGRGAADLDFVIDVTQTEPRSMSLQVIIYSPFSPVSPCFWTFQVFCFRFILRLITQSLLISTPDMLLQSEKVRHQRRFGPFCSLFYIYIILCVSHYHIQSYSSEGKKINWPKSEFPGNWSLRGAQEAQLFEGNRGNQQCR